MADFEQSNLTSGRNARVTALKLYHLAVLQKWLIVARVRVRQKDRSAFCLMLHFKGIDRTKNLPTHIDTKLWSEKEAHNVRNRHALLFLRLFFEPFFNLPGAALQHSMRSLHVLRLECLVALTRASASVCTQKLSFFWSVKRCFLFSFVVPLQQCSPLPHQRKRDNRLQRQKGSHNRHKCILDIFQTTRLF